MRVEIIGRTDAPKDVLYAALGTPYRNESVTGETLRKVLKAGHLSVLEHVSWMFRIEGLSRVAQQQLTRHRMASYTIQSQRRTRWNGLVVCPKTVLQAEANSKSLQEKHLAFTKLQDDFYESLLQNGVPLEDARYYLPEGAESGTIILTMNARELRHFFSLRCAPPAQWEIRLLAVKMKELVAADYPELFEEIGQHD